MGVCCVCAAASVDQQTLLSNTQEDTPSELNDEVDSNQLDSTNTGIIPVQRKEITEDVPNKFLVSYPQSQSII